MPGGFAATPSSRPYYAEFAISIEDVLTCG